jgi:phenylpropionate dioxygenase-like ring-hydroxylating dioxygenase large terminal subunit
MTSSDSLRPNAPPPVADFDDLVREDKVHRRLYTDPAIFTAEMRAIFGGVWVYLAHESQVPKNDDFVVSQLGLRAVIVTRDGKGRLRALFNRCTHRGATICRETKGSAKTFQCPYHGWTYQNSGKLAGVPWPDGYGDDFADDAFNLAQVPRVESYRGFIFGTLNAEAPSLLDYLGAVRQPIDEWLNRHPGHTVKLCEANRLSFKGNWKLAYDNAADGYHVIFSHRSLLAMEARLKEGEKGMSFYKDRPDQAPMYVRSFGHGHHFKDKRPNISNTPGSRWEIEAAHPGMEAYEKEIRRKLGDKAGRALDLAASEPVNINVFPNLLILGNHIQVLQPVSVDETQSTWYGTAVVDEKGELGGTVDQVNALRMRTQEAFPNFGEVDDMMNFEHIQRGLGIEEDPWVYMHRGLGVPDRIKVEAGGIVTGPATDELFMREMYKEYRRLMKLDPTLNATRRVDG